MSPARWATTQLVVTANLDAYGYEKESRKISARFLALLLNQCARTGQLRVIVKSHMRTQNLSSSEEPVAYILQSSLRWAAQFRGKGFSITPRVRLSFERQS